MPENSYQDTIDQINKMEIQLRTRLEQVSKLRVDCAKEQLELLKLYKPQCLNILETLRDLIEPPEFSDKNDGNFIKCLDNNNEVLTENTQTFC